MAKKSGTTREQKSGTTREQKGGEDRSGEQSEEKRTQIKKLEGHGHRTLITKEQDMRQAAREEAEAEDFRSSELRPSNAGPDPYNIPKQKDTTAYDEAVGESKVADAEVSTIGSDPLTDTGAKIRLNPDRLGADDKVELPRAKSPHEEATATAPKDALTAEKNIGAISVKGGGKHE